MVQPRTVVDDPRKLAQCLNFHDSRDQNKCVLCGDCVRACHEIQSIGAIDFRVKILSWLKAYCYMITILLE